MGSAVADLTGSGNQQVWGNVYRVSQNQAGNYSTYYGEIRYYGNGWGTWTGSNIYWQMSAPGLFVNGNFTIPYDRRFDTYTVLWSGYWNVGHDGNGNMGGFTADCHINGDVHSSIGHGSCYPPEGAAPRIPKRPSPPGTPTFSEILPTSVRVSWAGSGDNGGAGIDGYLLRRRDEPGSGYTDAAGQANNTSRVVSGLTPGEDYFFSVYAHNGSADNNGYSNPSAEVGVTLPAGIYVSDGAAWVATSGQVSDGDSWDTPFPQISDGDSWEDPIDV